MLRLVEIIREKGITNVTLAKMLNVTPQYIGEVVNGHRNITVDKAKRIADALEVPLAALFEGYASPAIHNIVQCPYCGKSIRLLKTG